MRIVVLFGLVTLTAGCEVSVFGSEPIVVIGEHSSGGTEWAHACEEPEAAREARLHEDAGEDTESSCNVRCQLIGEGASLEGCETVTEVSVGGAVVPGRFQLDVHDHEGVILTFEVCDPSGTALQVGDSPTTAAAGGDTGSSSHDADLVLSGTTLTVRPATAAETPASVVENWVAASGCTTRTLVLSEQLLYLVDDARGLCGPGLFRIDPPTDTEGTPDARWFLSAAGSLDGTVAGSGVRSLSACFW